MNNTFNLDDLSKSKGLAANLNSEINSVSSELKSLETNSTQIKTDISKINLEISTERAALTKISTLSNSSITADNRLACVSFSLKSPEKNIARPFSFFKEWTLS